MTGRISVHPHVLAAQAVTQRAEAPLSCNVCYAETSGPLDPVTHLRGVRYGFWSRYLSHAYPAAAMVDQTLRLPVVRRIHL